MSSAPIPITVMPTPALDHARVLIVDDSAVARAFIARVVDATDRYVVTRTVSTAAAALQFLATEQVEFILLDIQMPGVDGLTALPDLLAAGGSAKVIVVSSSAGEGAAATIQALALGAADTLVKPSGNILSARFAKKLFDKLDRLGFGAEEANRSAVPQRPVPVPSLPAPRPATASLVDPVSRRSAGGDFDIVAIGASTGGIHALGHLLRGLPASFRLPIVITQHLPPSFMPYFAAQIAVLAGRPCEVARDGMRIRPGRVIVAPGDAHLRFVSVGEGAGAIRYSREPSTTGCMPSVDPMLSTMADVYGPRLLAVILSGMGRDGLEGARAVRAAGGTIVVQDKSTSVIWGMPGSVAQAGLADAIMPPGDIGSLVASGHRP